MVGLLTQGAASGDGGPELLPLAAPCGLPSDARLGLSKGRSGLLPLDKCPVSPVPVIAGSFIWTADLK